MDSGDLNSGPDAYTASILSTGPFLQPKVKDSEMIMNLKVSTVQDASCETT